MRVSIEIPDPVLAEARAVAAREQTSLRALVEEGLRKTLESRRQPGRFRLRDASFGGRGLRPEIRERDWATIRSLAYVGRGNDHTA